MVKESKKVYIKKLIIDNFQSHQHTELEFSERFNIISGPSDHGKSAIIRAIKWVFYNEPRGTDFIRHGTSTAKVTCQMSNGCTIVRERSQSKNRYILTYPDGREMAFESFGNEIPEEVVRAHGIPKVQLDSDLGASLNIGEQLQGPFLLSETGAVRAKAIGRLSGLHIIDKAIRNCNVDIRRESQSMERTKKEIEEVEVNLKEYSRLEDIKERLDESEKLINRLEALISRRERIGALQKEFLTLNDRYKEVKELYDRLGRLKECEIDIKNCELKQRSLERLGKIKGLSTQIEGEMNVLSRVIEKSSHLDECACILNNIIMKEKSLEKLAALKASLDRLNREINDTGRQLKTTENADALEHIIKLAEEKKDKAERIAVNLKALKEINKNFEELNKILCQTGNIDKLSQCISDIINKTDALNKYKNMREQLDTVENYIKEGKKYIEKNQKEIEISSSKYIEALKSAGKCPLCGSEISDSCLNDIIKHYGEV
jgi:exonuclease SbcC